MSQEVAGMLTLAEQGSVCRLFLVFSLLIETGILPKITHGAILAPWVCRHIAGMQRET